MGEKGIFAANALPMQLQVCRISIVDIFTIIVYAIDIRYYQSEGFI